MTNKFWAFPDTPSDLNLTNPNKEMMRYIGIHSAKKEPDLEVTWNFLLTYTFGEGFSPLISEASRFCRPATSGRNTIVTRSWVSRPYGPLLIGNIYHWMLQDGFLLIQVKLLRWLVQFQRRNTNSHKSMRQGLKVCWRIQEKLSEVSYPYIRWYCWWKKSANQLRLVGYPIISKV